MTGTVPVSLGSRSYAVHIGAGLLEAAESFIPPEIKTAGRTLFVLTDENAAPYGKAVYGRLKRCEAADIQFLVLPAGEASKSWQGLERVTGWLLAGGAGRDSLLFTVGGGVIGDLGGLAAALAMRGIPYIQVPTTLLAQVDSAVGGKTAIDTPQGKNLVGAFHQPAAVVCDTDVLRTLPEREILAGYAEIVKYGLIADEPFFRWLEENGAAVRALDPAALAQAVTVSCRAKADVVERDERESGLRALLNFGHTFGHALEAAAGYDGKTLLHGEAVAIGMVMAFRLSARLGHCSAADAGRAEAHLAAAGLPVEAAGIFPPPGPGVEEIVDYMRRDKKMSGGAVRFVLSKGIGRAFVAEGVPLDEARRVLLESLEGRRKGNGRP